MKSLANPPEPVSPVTSASGLAFTHIQTLREQLSRLPEVARFTDEQVEIIYGMAYAMFSQGKLDVAHGLFETLTIYRPLDARILLAHGICCKRMLRFEEAIASFTSAYFIDPDELNSVIHLSECLAVTGKLEDCKRILEPVISFADIDEKYLSLKKRALTLKEMLEKSQISEINDGK